MLTGKDWTNNPEKNLTKLVCFIISTQMSVEIYLRFQEVVIVAKDVPMLLLLISALGQLQYFLPP